MCERLPHEHFSLAQPLGGLEYFLNRAWTVKGETQYHWVDERPGVNPDGLAMRIGLTHYF